MKKERYEIPQMEITRFAAEDIIRTSNLDDDELPIIPFEEE